MSRRERWFWLIAFAGVSALMGCDAILYKRIGSAFGLVGMGAAMMMHIIRYFPRVRAYVLRLLAEDLASEAEEAKEGR